MRCLAVVLLCLASLPAQARPSLYPPVTQFSGDRYGAQAHMGPEVVRAIGCPPPACVRSKKLNRRATAAQRRRWRRVPMPAPRPRNAAPPVTSGGDRAVTPVASLGRGLLREAGRAIGRPAAWCGWWLGQHLGMPARHLWLARNWAKVGSNTGGPQVGAIVVWPHHVGLITGRRGNQWVIKSGNDGHTVRERPRSIAGAIAFRRV